MILTCPECSTKYLTKPEAIGPNGRTVRCAKCSESWFVSAEEASENVADARALEEDLQSKIPDITPVTTKGVPLAPDAPKPDVDEITANHGAHVTMRDKADAEKLSRRRRTIWLIWLIPLMILIAGAILSYVFRQEIVNRIPQTATIYKAFGVTVKESGLEIESPTARTAIVEGQTILVVNSAILNISDKSQRVPNVEISLHNGAGEQVAQWYIEPKETRLDAKGRLEIAAQYPDPPIDAVKMRFNFASEAAEF